MHRKSFSAVLTSVLCAASFVPAHALPLAPFQDASSPTSSDGNTQSMEQGGMHRGPMSPDQELSHLTKALDLTSDQQSRLKPILQDRHDQLMQIHQDGSMSRQEKMAKMRTLDDGANNKVQAILNPEQKTKYDKMVADRKERMAHMRAMRHNGGDSEQPQ